MNLSKSLVFLFLILSFFLGCSNGSNDNSNDNPSLLPDQNACDVIGLNTKITNGTPCRNSERSAIVRILLRLENNQAATCTGTMITNNKLITAAHCFENVRQAAIQIGDSLNINQVINGTVVYIHPDFSNPNNLSNRNDIEILELERNPNIPVMPILVGREIEEGEIVSVFGYGQEESGDISDSLRSGEMKVSDVTDAFIKALYDGRGSNVCFGDSGGPMIASHNGGIALVATTSFGTRTDCQAGDITSFIKLQSEDALEFINRHAPEANFR